MGISHGGELVSFNNCSVDDYLVHSLVKAVVDALNESCDATLRAIVDAPYSFAYALSERLSLGGLDVLDLGHDFRC